MRHITSALPAAVCLPHGPGSWHGLLAGRQGWRLRRSQRTPTRGARLYLLEVLLLVQEDDRLGAARRHVVHQRGVHLATLLVAPACLRRHRGQLPAPVARQDSLLVAQRQASERQAYTEPATLRSCDMFSHLYVHQQWFCSASRVRHARQRGKLCTSLLVRLVHAKYRRMRCRRANKVNAVYLAPLSNGQPSAPHELRV